MIRIDNQFYNLSNISNFNLKVLIFKQESLSVFSTHFDSHTFYTNTIKKNVIIIENLLFFMILQGLN